MRIENITIAYGNRTILRNITINIVPGDFVFLIGDSGSGKTSFINTLIGGIVPKSGQIFDNRGTDIATYDTRRMAEYRRGIGVVFQDYKLLTSKTVRENVAFAMEVCGYPDRHIIQRVPEVLSQVGLLPKIDSFVHMLSGGEAQRVAIARALIHDPDTILGDEPTGNLDPRNADDVMGLLLDLNKRGKTIIVATHDERIVNNTRKRVVAFKEGRVASDTKEGGYCL